MSNTNQPVVLIVDDQLDVARSYELWLDDTYDVRCIESGTEALSQLDDVDVVLLDRMMPGMSGDEVLEAIRERGAGCRVAMVTAVDPGFDIIEMGFDEYLTKPAGKEQIRETVEQLLRRVTLDDDLQEYYSLVARRSVLEAQFSEEKLTASEEYSSLVAQIETLQSEIDESMGDMDSDVDFVGAVREITSDGTDETDVSDTSRRDGPE